jgi:hypothetical protein
VPIDFDQGFARERDRKLRHALLEVLHLARGVAPIKGLSGRRLVMQAEQSFVEDLRFDGDRHAMQLLQDLADKGLIVLERAPRPKRQDVTPDYVFARLTDKGGRLCRGEADPDPDVWDPRAVGDEA